MKGVSDQEFIAAWEKHGSPSIVGTKLGISSRAAMNRRRAIEARHGIKLDTWNDLSCRRVTIKGEEGRIDLSLDDGVVIVFSDAHFTPGVRTTMLRALLAMIRQLKPAAVICNGDAFDGATVGRWPRIGWQKRPSVIEELKACQEALTEIEEAAGTAELIWPLGNHDARFETRLASAAPEYEGLEAFSLRYYFDKWRPCWTCWVNEETIVTHFYHSGMHAVHNNLLKGQVNYVTGHTHSLQTRPWTNAQGRTLWGVDTGSLADSLAAHNVDYQQGRHGNHRSGFAVLTFRDGELLMPEIAMKHDEDHFVFRGHILNADSGEVV